MHLQVKKLKVDIFITPRKNSLPGSYHHALGREKLLINQAYENLFQNVLL